MIQNLITEYVHEPYKHVLYSGKVMLQRGYYFVNGNEKFYEFVGNNSCYSFKELLDPEDADAFEHAVSLLKEDTQYIVCRLKDKNNRYCLLYVKLELSDRVVDDFQLITAELCDFMQLKEKFDEYILNVKKYRQFMSLIPTLFFEYSYDDDRLLIYQYVSQKSIPIFDDVLSEKLELVLQNRSITEEDKKQFFIFCEVLRTQEERYEVVVPAKMFSKQNVDGNLHFKGTSLYRFGEKKLNVGIIEAAGLISTEEHFYRSQNAFDTATGLFNKRAINEYAVERITECSQTGESIYLAVLDVDEFKGINDKYGHMTGDEVLAKLAEILRAVVDNRGYCGRFGGDEFLIVFDRVQSEEKLRTLIKTVMKNLHFAFQDRFSVTTSWGISQYPKDGKTYETLFEVADKALYIAKYKGKNRFIIYDESKHGSVNNVSEKAEVNGIRALANDMQKAKIISDLMVMIHKEKENCMSYVMETVREYFDIDGITIYTGEDMHRAYTSGNYVEPIQKFPWIRDAAYCQMFDESGVYKESTIQKLKNLFPDAYEVYVKQETGEFLQCGVSHDKKVMSLISFDYFNRSPKIGNTDQGFLVIIGRLLAEVACNS